MALDLKAVWGSVMTIVKSPVAWMLVLASLAEIAAGVLQVSWKANYFVAITIRMVASFLQSIVAWGYLLYREKTLKIKLSRKETFLKFVHLGLSAVKFTIVLMDFLLLGFKKFAISVEISCVNQLLETMYTLAFDRKEKEKNDEISQQISSLQQDLKRKDEEIDGLKQELVRSAQEIERLEQQLARIIGVGRPGDAEEIEEM